MDLVTVDYLDNITNEEVYNTIRQPTDQHTDMLATITSANFKLNYSATADKGVSRTILQGGIRSPERRKWARAITN